VCNQERTNLMQITIDAYILKRALNHRKLKSTDYTFSTKQMM